MTEETKSSRCVPALSKWNPKIDIRLAVAVIACALIGAGVLIWKFVKDEQKAHKQQIAIVNERPFVEAGDELELTLGLIATDQRALHSAQEALEKKDRFTLNYLESKLEKLIRVPKQTRVLILENSDGESKVRVVSGKYKGTEGWVSDYWFK